MYSMCYKFWKKHVSFTVSIKQAEVNCYLEILSNV